MVNINSSRCYKKLSRNYLGYTLIEILIVIVIIGILAIIAIINISGYSETAERSVVLSNMRTFLSELEAEKNQQETYPDLPEEYDESVFNSQAWKYLEEEDGFEFEYTLIDGSDFYAVAIIEEEIDSNEEGDYIIISPEGLQQLESAPEFD